MSSHRPNVVVIYADQMRADMMGCSGNTVIKTPHLDRLAREGTRFANAFVSYPWCTPFRASLFTGKYAQGHGLHQNHFPIDTDQNFLAELLKQQGYRTGYIGKWHLNGGPKPGFVPPGKHRLGFDHFVGFNRGHEYMNAIYFKDTDQPYHSPRYEPEFQADHLIEFIESSVSAGDDKPFFGFVCFGPPHHPMNVPDDVRISYDPAEVPLPPGVPDMELQRRFQEERLRYDCDGVDKAHSFSKAKSEKLPGAPETEDEIRKFVAGYYGMITHIDGLVGRILDRLKALDVTDNTMFVFLSDHGDMLGQHGYFCGIKSTAYRAAAHVPFIVRYPDRFAGGHVVDAPVDIAVDTFSTILEMVGIDVPDEHQGISYLPLLDGSAHSTRDVVMYQSMKQADGSRGEYTPVPERGIRTAKWLYVRQPNRRKLLVDLVNDPDELSNLVADTAYDTVMDELDELVYEHMRATGDDWELHCTWPPKNWITHGDARRLIDEVLLPNAIVET